MLLMRSGALVREFSSMVSKRAFGNGRFNGAGMGGRQPSKRARYFSYTVSLAHAPVAIN
jgi:hypothetical protein